MDTDAPEREVVDLTRRLAAIPSHDDETAAGDAIAAWLRDETDADVTRDDAGNVIARRSPPGGAPDAPSLAFVGHHDVVPPADGQTTGDGEYVVEERDGRLYGRGTADMKGAVAAALCAFRDSEVSRASGRRPEGGDADAGASPGDLVFASFVGEETGGEGARAAVDAGFAPDYAVVGEGSTNYSGEDVTDVAVAHKGRRGSTLVARGTAVHASEADRGENAVCRACDAVDVVRAIDPPTATVLGHDLRGSVVVTGIEGGSAWNVVPERCEVTVDERTVPGARAPLARTESVAGVEWTVDQDLPPMACSAPDFADAVRDAADAAQAGTPESVVKPHATDAGWLAEAGTACVVCGPAEPGEAHTDDESVSVDVLARCYRIYRAVAEQGPT
ncbi:MAG: M20 family metallopeptidase [Haloferacaceae archaeon]